MNKYLVADRVTGRILREYDTLKEASEFMRRQIESGKHGSLVLAEQIAFNLKAEIFVGGVKIE